MTSTSDKTLEAEQQAEMGQQSMECPLCCPSCASQPKSHLRPGPSDPLALSNFLPAGVIQISAPSQRLCRHSHAEDGWHPFTKRPYASEGKELYFLVEHKFIYATCQLTGDGDFLTVRVYIIPYDLARYGGKLRNRDEAKVVAPARKILRTFLPKIVQDPELWKGRRADASSSPKTFLPLTIVRQVPGFRFIFVLTANRITVLWLNCMVTFHLPISHLVVLSRGCAVNCTSTSGGPSPLCNTRNHLPRPFPTPCIFRSWA
jgi:hypothetical protein